MSGEEDHEVIKPNVPDLEKAESGPNLPEPPNISRISTHSILNSIDNLLVVGEQSLHMSIQRRSIGRMEKWKIKISEILKNPRYGKEALRTMVAILTFGIVTSLMMMAQMESDRWFDYYVKSLALSTQKLRSLAIFRQVFAIDPLHDLLFERLPDWTDARGWLPDICLTTFIMSTVLFNVLWVHRQRIEFQGLVVLRRVLWVMSCLYMFRIWTFLATTVPSPIHNCVPKYVQVDNFDAYIRLIGNMASGKISACTDNIYSGHTALTTVMVFTFFMYSGVIWLNIYALLHGILIISTILLTRLHYTVDVLIAMFMSSFVFLTFHFLLTIMLDDSLLNLSTIDNVVGINAILNRERRALHRIYNKDINAAIWWLDGFDLRLEAHIFNGLQGMEEIVQSEIREEPSEDINHEACSTKSHESLNVC